MCVILFHGGHPPGVCFLLTKVCVVCQIRRALLQLLFPGKPFHWLRHITIAMCLLFAVNLLVILVPNIRDIFGITGDTFNSETQNSGLCKKKETALV